MFLTPMSHSFSQSIYHSKGSTLKIEQLVGDLDRQTNEPTGNRTNSRYSIWGTDLGISFRHAGKTYFLFGDIPGDIGYGVDRDPLAYSTDQDPDDGIDLEFVTEETGIYKPISVPGISHGAFEVPVDGISIGDTMYVYLIAGNPQKLVLARSLDDGLTFELIESNISQDKFLNVSINQINRFHFPGLPGDFEKGIVALGSGPYRQSPIYMYCQSMDSIEYRESIYYFAGYQDGNPVWSRTEPDAQPVIPVNCVGELSSMYVESIQKWLVLYNCEDPRGINLRYADYPWGPFSNSQIIFEPWEDNGYCNFIHTNWQFRNCDAVHDPSRENEWGGEYGPYLIKEFAKLQDSILTIYYTLSTWNPYTVVLMKSDMVITDFTSDAAQIQGDLKIEIFPNPAGSKLYFKSDLPLPDQGVVELMDASGRILFRQPFAPEIDISHLSKALYFGQIRTQTGERVVFKVMKMP